MLKVSAVSKSYGPDLVLQNISFVLNRGEHVGLVGPNGSGKSTLLKLLARELAPDSGSVWLSPGDRIAYLPQYPLDELALTVRASLLRGAGRVGELRLRVEALERSMPAVEGERLETLLSEYARVQEEFEQLGGYELEARLEQVVHGLDLEGGLDLPVSALSGGNKTKLSLARLLLSGASFMLLDEPTNYLDLPALLWLERFVNESDGGYIIVSHDRRFLDRTVEAILELDPIEHTLREWPGNYSDYAIERMREEQRRLAAYRDQQEEIARIEEDIRRTNEWSRRAEASGGGAFRRTKRVARKAKVRERRLERMLSAETIEKPRQSWGLHLVDLGRDPIGDERIVLEVQGLRAGYDGKEVVRGIDLLIRGRDRVAVLGTNGSGKSTLLRCITDALPFQGTIGLGPSVRVGVMTQEGEELPADRTVLDLFRSQTSMYEDEARTYLHKFLFTGEEVFKPLHALSYGQRAKFALAVLIVSQANFLILDEPTGHLDMPALEAVEGALAQYRGPLLLVSHDRYFLERVGVNRIEVLDQGRLRAVDSIEEYERELTGREAC